MKKKELEIALSGLNGFEKQRLDLEQYQTEAHVAADLLWYAYMRGDIAGKVVADFGCGNGIFGVGALLLGAKKVVFVDVDKKALELAKVNVANVEKEVGERFDKSFFNVDIRRFNRKVDVVLTNPPFGVKKSHADKPFLLKIVSCSKIGYSFHKIESKNFVERVAEDEGWVAQMVRKYDFPLRMKESGGYRFWKKKVYFVNVGVWRMVHLD